MLSRRMGRRSVGGCCRWLSHCAMLVSYMKEALQALLNDRQVQMSSLQLQRFLFFIFSHVILSNFELMITVNLNIKLYDRTSALRIHTAERPFQISTCVSFQFIINQSESINFRKVSHTQNEQKEM
jgi:hypothetical protein